MATRLLVRGYIYELLIIKAYGYELNIYPNNYQATTWVMIIERLQRQMSEGPNYIYIAPRSFFHKVFIK